MTKYYLIAFCAVLMTAASQVLMKFGTRRAAKNTWSLYLNGYMLTAYAMLLVVTLLNLYAYKYIPLKTAVALLPATLLLVLFFSYWLLAERLTRVQVLGALLILAGVGIFGL